MLSSLISIRVCCFTCSCWNLCLLGPMGARKSIRLRFTCPESKRWSRLCQKENQSVGECLQRVSLEVLMISYVVVRVGTTCEKKEHHSRGPTGGRVVKS